jgi:hypothetical protein
MKTKLLAFILIFTVLVPQTFAQKRRTKIDSGIQFGILGGIGMQSFIGKDFNGNKLNYNLTPSFHIGVNASLNLAPDLFFQLGLSYITKGAKQELLEDMIRTIRLSYIEMPLNILYRPQLGDGHILLGVGPYAAYGIMGKERVKIETITTELSVKFLSDASEEPATYAYYRAPDAGVNILFGYEFYSGIFLHLNGQMGLLKVNPSYDISNDPTSKKNLGFGLSVGYRF